MLDNNKARLITWLYIILVDALLQLFLKLLVDRIYPGGKPAAAEGIQKKLSNERFVNNAPAAVVELERKKLSDAESKIATLQQTIDGLK